MQRDDFQVSEEDMRYSTIIIKKGSGRKRDIPAANHITKIGTSRKVA